VTDLSATGIINSRPAGHCEQLASCEADPRSTWKRFSSVSGLINVLGFNGIDPDGIRPSPKHSPSLSLSVSTVDFNFISDNAIVSPTPPTSAVQFRIRCVSDSRDSVHWSLPCI